nr:hypothetical protein CFP56_12091 [Quercus suber]
MRMSVANAHRDVKSTICQHFSKDPRTSPRWQSSTTCPQAKPRVKLACNACVGLLEMTVRVVRSDGDTLEYSSVSLDRVSDSMIVARSSDIRMRIRNSRQNHQTNAVREVD